jgi:hypothetical protein
VRRASWWTQDHLEICRKSTSRYPAALIDLQQGKDATEEFDPIHPPDTLDKYLDKSKHLGQVDMGTVEKVEKEESPEEKERQARIERMPILEQCYNLMDFEAVARPVMKKTAWAYYSSGADDEIVCPLANLQEGIEANSCRQ